VYSEVTEQETLDEVHFVFVWGREERSTGLQKLLDEANARVHFETEGV